MFKRLTLLSMVSMFAVAACADDPSPMAPEAPLAEGRFDNNAKVTGPTIADIAVAAATADENPQFTILVAGLSELIEMLHLTDRLPSNGHTVVSNVPGPRKPLYIKGSKVEGMYPISTLSPGLRMNITLFSYADTLHLGIVATEHMVGLQVLADGIVNEFKRLDAALARPADTEVSP